MHMNKPDLSLNNLESMIYHKIKPNQAKQMYLKDLRKLVISINSRNKLKLCKNTFSKLFFLRNYFNISFSQMENIKEFVRIFTYFL